MGCNQLTAGTRKELITIVSTINKNYLLPLSVTANSLLQNKGKRSRIDWFVFESEVSAEEKIGFDQFYRETDIRFHWVTLSAREFENLSTWGRAVPRMYQRLAIPDFFQDRASRVLYLDADLLVLGDIEELLDVELGDKAVAAVQDMVIPRVSSPLGLSNYKQMGLPLQTHYFNAGILLMNLPVWREESIVERALEYLKTAKNVGLMDQDGLNAVLHSSWLPLHYRWNIIGSVAGRPFFKAKHLDRALYEEAMKSPGIVHFAGHLKPWQIGRLGSRWDADYKECLSLQHLDYSLDATRKARKYSFYDRYLRSCLYLLERELWKRVRRF